MPGWIQIDSSKVDPPTPVNVKGVEFNVFMSPYDVPRHVRGRFDENLGRFVIEFDYLDTEPCRRQTLEEHVSVSVGKNSGRLYRIEVDTKAMNAGRVALRVKLKDLKLEPRGPEGKRNFDAVKRTLTTYDDELLQALST
jgi:hypothetical protein